MFGDRTVLLVVGRTAANFVIPSKTSKQYSMLSDGGSPDNMGNA